MPRLWTAMVLRRFLWRTTFIAITGSNGKSTATRYLAAILSSHAPTQYTRLNRNALDGFTETIEKAGRLIRPDISVVLSVFLEHRSFFKSLEAVAKSQRQQKVPDILR